MSTQISLSRPIKLEVNVTPITGGSAGQILFQTTGNTVGESANLFWDNTNGRLGIGGTPSAFKLDIVGTSSANIIGVKVRNTSTNGYTEINCYNNTGGDNDRIYFGVGGTATGDVYQNRGYFISSLALEGITFTAGKTTTGDMRFFTGGNNERLRIFGNGNVAINTTTDAGFKLDVNGTARFTGQFSSGASSNFQICQSNGTPNFQVRADGYVQFNNYTPLSGGTMNFLDGSRITMFGGGPLAGNINQLSMTHLFQTNINSHTYTGILISTTINQTGGANGITRGLYIAPTLTAAADFRAIETTNGKVIFGNLPTSPAGLPTGAIWNNLGILTIV